MTYAQAVCSACLSFRLRALRILPTDLNKTCGQFWLVQGSLRSIHGISGDSADLETPNHLNHHQMVTGTCSGPGSVLGSQNAGKVTHILCGTNGLSSQTSLSQKVVLGNLSPHYRCKFSGSIPNLLNQSISGQELKKMCFLINTIPVHSKLETTCLNSAALFYKYGV
jgi:hypothetical protein